MIKRLAIAILLLAAFPSWADENEISQIESDLKYVRSQIETAQKEDDKYAGGLIKTIITQRIETLKLTEALLDQKRLALREGADFNFTINVHQPDPDREAALMKEITEARQELKKAEAEAARYAGGLIRGLALTGVATQRQTIAMLTQAALSARYGLAASSVSPPLKNDRDIPTTGSSSATEPTEDCLQLEGLDSRVVERNEVYVNLAWKVDVVNACDRNYSLMVSFALHDDSDFQIEEDLETSRIGPFETAKIRTQTMISPPSKYDRAVASSANLSVFPH